jgi:hypothetical protein
VTVNFGRSFSHKKPLRAFPYNASSSSSEDSSLMALYQKYFSMGISLSESGDTGCIKGEGTLALSADLGQSGDMDPLLLLLSWKMQVDSAVWEFSAAEWRRLALHGVFEIDALRSLVKATRSEIQNDKESFKSFYNYVFDYLKPDKATALDRDEALMVCSKFLDAFIVIRFSHSLL